MARNEKVVRNAGPQGVEIVPYIQIVFLEWINSLEDKDNSFDKDTYTKV